MTQFISRVRLALDILNIILRGWANSDHGRITFGNLDRKHARWCVYEMSTNDVWQVIPDGRKSAEREAEREGVGFYAMPLALARYSKNVWAHGRASNRS